MPDGHRSGRSTGRVSCKSTAIIIIIIIIILTPLLNSQGKKNIRYAIQKSTKIKLELPRAKVAYSATTDPLTDGEEATSPKNSIPAIDHLDLWFRPFSPHPDPLTPDPK